MTQQHPITPPRELVQQWVDAYFGGTVAQTNFHLDLANRAAQWGADQELEACCEWLEQQTLCGHQSLIPSLRAARRPKPPSLKETLLEALKDLGKELPIQLTAQYGTVRHALEQLPDHE